MSRGIITTNTDASNDTYFCSIYNYGEEEEWSTATVQHTSTSEAVKTRPRKRTRITTLPAAGVDAIPKKTPRVESKQVHMRSSRSIALVHLDKLAKIWDSDKRIPMVEPRRAWALAQNVGPDHVHRWWARRKQIAEKARLAIPKARTNFPLERLQSSRTRRRHRPRSRTTILLPPLPIPSSPPLQDLRRNSTPRSLAPFSPYLSAQSPLPPSSPPLASSPARVLNTSVLPLRLPSLGLALSTTPVPNHIWCTQGRTNALEPSHRH